MSSKENILRKLFETKSKITRPIGLGNRTNCVLEKTPKASAIDVYEVFILLTILNNKYLMNQIIKKKFFCKWKTFTVVAESTAHVSFSILPFDLINNYNY